MLASTVARQQIDVDSLPGDAQVTRRSAQLSERHEFGLSDDHDSFRVLFRRMGAYVLAGLHRRRALSCERRRFAGVLAEHFSPTVSLGGV
jgi:hypothetical protein